MTDFNTLSTVPFGWLKLILFYIVFIAICFFIKKIRTYLTSRRLILLEIIYVFTIIIIGGSYFIIFVYGEYFYLGSLFIEKGNREIIRYSSFFFMIFLSIYYSPKIRND